MNLELKTSNYSTFHFVLLKYFLLNDFFSETYNYDIILDLDRGTTQRSSSSSGQALSSYNRRDDLNQSVRTSSSLDRSSSLGKTDTSRSQQYSSVGSQQYSSKSQLGSSQTQYSRDRQEGLGRQTGGSGSGRQKWSINDNRGSVSPGKENMDQNGYRYLRNLGSEVTHSLLMSVCLENLM